MLSSISVATPISFRTIMASDATLDAHQHVFVRAPPAFPLEPTLLSLPAQSN